jgi:hypothetical protein
LFSTAISFTDKAENFQRHVQNPHEQAVLTVPIWALYTCPELSNRYLKKQKPFAGNFLVPEPAETYHVIIFGLR